jgi:hypothetical protein
VRRATEAALIKADMLLDVRLDVIACSCLGRYCLLGYEALCDCPACVSDWYLERTCKLTDLILFVVLILLFRCRFRLWPIQIAVWLRMITLKEHPLRLHILIEVLLHHVVLG